MKEVLDAILFAAQSHNGQYRKDGHTPYINHPLDVMHLLAHAAEVADHEILMAAVLHDVVEDTDVTGEEIAKRFGPRVARIVLELTDDKMLTKEERKHQQLLHADALSADTRLVRISDKICNVRDILYAPPGNWNVTRRLDYLDWAMAVVDKIRGTNAVLEIRFDELVVEGRRLLGEEKKRES